MLISENDLKTNFIGAGAGDWTDAESAQALRPCQNMDVTLIKGEVGDVNTCKRCQGKVRSVTEINVDFDSETGDIQ